MTAVATVETRFLYIKRVARFFLVHDTKTGKNVQNGYTMYQMVINYPKYPWNIPSGHKIYKHFPILGPQKFTSIGIFVLKTNHLATLNGIDDIAYSHFLAMGWKYLEVDILLIIPPLITKPRTTWVSTLYLCTLILGLWVRFIKNLSWGLHSSKFELSWVTQLTKHRLAQTSLRSNFSNASTSIFKNRPLVALGNTNYGPGSRWGSVEAWWENKRNDKRIPGSLPAPVNLFLNRPRGT
jgi:hypothetical protein